MGYITLTILIQVIVTTKNNDDKQYIWESDSASYTVVEDPRGRYRYRQIQEKAGWGTKVA